MKRAIRAAVLPGLFDLPVLPTIREPKPVRPVVQEKRRLASNEDKVLSHLKARGSAMNWELVAIGGMGAMRRVHDLREKGHQIDTRRVEGGVWRVDYKGGPTS